MTLQTLDLTLDEGVLTAVIHGTAVEQHRATAILEGIRKAVADAPDTVTHVVVDFEEVHFVNSSGLAAFVELHNEMVERGTATIAYRTAPDLLKVLKNAKLDELYAFAGTPDELAQLL